MRESVSDMNGLEFVQASPKINIKIIFFECSTETPDYIFSIDKIHSA